MPKGVTSQEVWSACDALLVQGDRPTIERVRQKMGRGSPNTVGPMLDTWFKGLGARLADPQAFSLAADLPEPVLELARQLWETASAQARGDFDARLQQGLAQAHEQRDAAMTSERTTQAQAQELRQTLAELREQNDAQREQHAVARAQLLDAQHQAGELRERVDRAHEQLERQLADSAQSLREAQDHAQANQRRLAQDLDAERQHRLKTERRAEALDATLQEVREQAHAADLANAECLARLQSQHEEREQALGRLQSDRDQLSAQLASALAGQGAAQRDAHALTQQLALAERLLAALKPSRAPRARTKSDAKGTLGRHAK